MTDLDRFLVSVLVCDGDLVVVGAQGGRVTGSGLDAGEMVSRPLAEVLGADAPAVLPAARAALAGRSGTFDCLLRGSARALRASVTRVPGANGMVSSVLVVVTGEHAADARSGARRAREAALYRAVTENLPDTAVMVFDRDLRYRMAYGEALSLNGWTSAQIEGRTPGELLPAPLAAVLEPLFRAAVNGDRGSAETPSVHGGRLLLTYAAPVADNELVAGVAISVDITERKLAERNSRRLAALVRQAQDAMLAVTPDGTVCEWNQAAERLYGRAAEDVIGLSIETIIPAELHQEQRAILRGVLAGGTIEYETERLARNAGRVRVLASASPILDEQGEVAGLSEIGREVSANTLVEQRLSHEATHDVLTGLPNRRAFERDLARAVSLAQRHHLPGAVLIVDVDHFKVVNDTHGHIAGDAALRLVARILQSRLRSSDTVARLGGDEFAITLTGVDADQALGVARELVSDIRADPGISTDGGMLRLTASAGVALLDATDMDSSQEASLERADAALYGAKRTGRDRATLAEPPARA